MSTESTSHRRFYDRIARAYDLIADAGEHEAREKGEAALAVRPGERVLEIGCGTGHSLVRFGREVGDDGRVVGVDVSSGMLEVAAGRVGDAGLDARVRLERADARDLPRASEFGGPFDAAFLSFTLELFSDDELSGVLGEISSVLTPDGRLGVVSMAEVAPGDRPSLIERTYVWMHRHFPHIVDCRPLDVEAVLQSSGWTDRRVEVFEMWTMPVAIVVARRAPASA